MKARVAALAAAHDAWLDLACRGVLFLDELPELGATKLEGLRQPLEDRTVTLARAAGTLSFPANFTLFGPMHPGRCGYHGDLRRACTCAAGAVARYRKGRQLGSEEIAQSRGNCWQVRGLGSDGDGLRERDVVSSLLVPFV